MLHLEFLSLAILVEKLKKESVQWLYHVSMYFVNTGDVLLGALECYKRSGSRPADTWMHLNST